jgi:hypothetical protein
VLPALAVDRWDGRGWHEAVTRAVPDEFRVQSGAGNSLCVPRRTELMPSQSVDIHFTDNMASLRPWVPIRFRATVYADGDNAKDVQVASGTGE